MSIDINKFSDAELMAELNRRETERRNSLKICNINPVGLWHVTTEGDCEGKSTKDLGIHQGHIVDIAYKLGSKSYYSLHFSPAKCDETVTPVKSVAISLPIESETWNMNPEFRKVHVAAMLARKACNQKYKIDTSNVFASVTIKY